MKNKKISAILSIVLVVSMFAGCGSEPANTSEQQTSETTSVMATETTVQNTTEETAVYPVAEGGTLSWWTLINANWSTVHSNLGETEFAKALTEQTGITVEFRHPAAGQHNDEFSFMVAEGNFPDLLEYNFTGYTGGPGQAIEDGVIIPLNDVIDQYCPNLKAYLEENPDVDKLIKTDDGTYYTFPMILGDEELGVTQGLFLRGDWLEELNLEVPKTIDEWHTVLTAFKEKGVETPFCIDWSALRNSPFVCAFGIDGLSYYLDDNGQVQYGAVQDEYKEFLMTMKQWYDEGLLDVDMASLKSDQITAKMTGETAGASYGWAASRMQSYVQTATQSNPNYTLVAAPVPVLNAGEVAEYGVATAKYSGKGVSISTDCKDVELAAKLLDYAYSEEGSLLYNYGVEGVSYEMKAGVPTYTELVTANPDGRPIGQMVAEYARANYEGPFVQELNYYTQYLQVETVKEAPNVWHVDTALDHKLPGITHTTEENEELTALTDGMTTYVYETILNFVLGTESFDNWDTFVQNMYKNFSLERVLEIKQQAVDRFNAR